MKKTTRRVYMSILLVVLSVFTAVATTFAWVGITSNTTFDKFRINLKENEADNNSEYGIQLSLSGKEGTFYDEINPDDIQMQILLNMGYEEAYIKRVGISQLFKMIKMEQCTVARRDPLQYDRDTRITDFYDMDGFSLVKSYDSFNDRILTCKGVIFFDLYVSIYSVAAEEDVSLSAPNIFLSNYLMEGNDCSAEVLNNITLDNYFSSPIYGNTKVNSANSTRVAIQRFDIVNKYDIAAYNSDIKRVPNDLKIFRNGSETPVYNNRSGLYDFGSIMQLGDNFAYKYYESIYGSERFNSLNGIIDFDRIKNRGDVLYENGTTSQSQNLILPASFNFNSSQMVKYRIYFWFEGWDGDCIEAIDGVPVTLNLEFSTKTNIE